MPYPTASRMCPTSVDKRSKFADDEVESSVAVADYSTVPLDLSSSPPVLDQHHYYRQVRNRTSSSASSVSDCGTPLPPRQPPPPQQQPLKPPTTGSIVWWEQHHLPFMPEFIDVSTGAAAVQLSSPVTSSKIMSRVVDNQREKFETDQYFRRLSRESEVRYAGVAIDRPLEQRRRQFEADVNNGFLIVSFLTSGIHMMLTFRNPRNVPEAPTGHDRDLSVAEIRNTQLVIQSKMILNGVCVIWTGRINMETLDGEGRLEFDAAAAEAEAVRTQGGAHRH